jgi:hypothetical protein
LIASTGTLFSFFFCLFWLCASLISRLALDIMLLQRLDVIGIILILIYFLYRKKCSCTDLIAIDVHATLKCQFPHYFICNLKSRC